MSELFCFGVKAQRSLIITKVLLESLRDINLNSDICQKIQGHEEINRPNSFIWFKSEPPICYSKII